METAVLLPFAGMGFVLGWPLEMLVQKFPLGKGTAPSTTRRLTLCALMAILFGLEVAEIGLVPELAPALLLTALVVPAATIDLEHRIIPNAINLPGALLVYMFAVAAAPDRMGELLIGGIGSFLLLWLAWRVYPAGMGLGDVKMALMIGLGLGYYAFGALLVAFLASTVLSIGLIVRFGPKARKMGFPMGPFLAFGAVVGLMWGAQLNSLLFGG
jgi:leader peptidase (prepilin peptidase) / N-methyltransferase